VVNVVNNKPITLYAIPAKNILHVVTNGITEFTMVDESGRILFAVNITGTGTIDVSRLSAGLYFLKDNNTGTVRKIIIAR
jgi:hypothetical protein